MHNSAAQGHVETQGHIGGGADRRWHLGQVGGSVKPNSLNIQAWHLRTRLVRLLKGALRTLHRPLVDKRMQSQQQQQQQQQQPRMSNEDVRNIAQCAATLIQVVWRMWRLREWLEQEYDRTMVELQISSLRYTVHMYGTHTRRILAVVRRLQSVWRARVMCRLRDRFMLENTRHLAIIHPALQSLKTVKVAKANVGYGRGNRLSDRRLGRMGSKVDGFLVALEKDVRADSASMHVSVEWDLQQHGVRASEVRSYALVVYHTGQTATVRRGSLRTHESWVKATEQERERIAEQALCPNGFKKKMFSSKCKTCNRKKEEHRPRESTVGGGAMAVRREEEHRPRESTVGRENMGVRREEENDYSDSSLDDTRSSTTVSDDDSFLGLEETYEYGENTVASMHMNPMLKAMVRQAPVTANKATLVEIAVLVGREKEEAEKREQEARERALEQEKQAVRDKEYIEKMYGVRSEYGDPVEKAALEQKERDHEYLEKMYGAQSKFERPITTQGHDDPPGDSTGDTQTAEGGCSDEVSHDPVLGAMFQDTSDLLVSSIQCIQQSQSVATEGGGEGGDNRNDDGNDDEDGIAANGMADGMAETPEHGLQYAAHFYMGSVKNTMTMVLPRDDDARYLFRVVNLVNMRIVAQVSMGCHHPQKAMNRAEQQRGESGGRVGTGRRRTRLITAGANTPVNQRSFSESKAEPVVVNEMEAVAVVAVAAVEGWEAPTGYEREDEADARTGNARMGNACGEELVAVDVDTVDVEVAL